MRRITPNPRGMALVMAMIVVVLITLLVAGAISFTGTERAASEIQSQEDMMSSCIQAARNLFLSKVQMSMLATLNTPTGPTDPAPPNPNGPQVLPVAFAEDLHEKIDPITNKPISQNVRTGHLGEVESWSAKKITALDDPLAQVNEIGMQTGASRVPTFYIVTAVCREDTSDPASAEREIEFMVRVGF